MGTPPARSSGGAAPGAVWTPEMVQACLSEAARTIARADSLRRIYPRQFGSVWPEIADRSLALIDQVDLKTQKPRLLPSSSAIDRAAIVIGWRTLVPAGDFDLLLLRAGGVRWATIERLDGRTRQALWARYKAGLLAIAAAISSDAKLALYI